MNLRGDGLQVPVGGGQKVRAAHGAIVERSYGGFGALVGGAWRGHFFDAPRGAAP